MNDLNDMWQRYSRVKMKINVSIINKYFNLMVAIYMELAILCPINIAITLFIKSYIREY